MSAHGALAEQMARVGAQSEATRAERRLIRQGLQAGTLTLDDVISDPPQCMVGLLIIDVIRMRYRRPGKMRGLTRINGAAVRAQVNLMLPLGDPRATRARAWLLAGGLDELWGTGYRVPPKRLSRAKPAAD